MDIASIARNTIRRAGYTHAEYGFSADSCGVLVSLDEQSPDIGLGVNKPLEIRDCPAREHVLDGLGAGDQGIMFGYASLETPELMPLPITLAHRLAQRLAQARKDRTLEWLRPDGKTQVTVEYEGRVPVRVDTVIVSAQHDSDVDNRTRERGIIANVIQAVIPEGMLDASSRILVNPTGRFEKGGPAADSGLTGRKLMVDTYGGMARHGGGALSGKDATKVDRSAAYAARHVAKNLVAAGVAHQCEVQIAYAIGVARPVAISVDTFGTGCISDEHIAEVVERVFDLRPAAIIDVFGLRRPVYGSTSCYGHFGRPELDLPWEQTDKVADIMASI